MKKLILLLALSVSAHARCTLHGVIRLSPPYDGLVCKVNGQATWVVGYAESYNAFMVTDVAHGISVFLPVKPKYRYESNTVSGPTGYGIIEGSRFVLTTESYEDDSRIPVKLETN